MKQFNIGLPDGLLVIALVLWPAAARSETAEENYRLYCVQCHGTMGTGLGINETSGGLSVTPRDHTNPMEMSKLNDRDLRLAIAEGGDAVQKSGLMPPFGSTLSSQEIDQLVVHLRKLCGCQGKK